jgi:hypothetical protein
MTQASADRVTLKLLELDCGNLAGNLKLHERANIDSMTKRSLEVMRVDEEMPSFCVAPVHDRWHLAFGTQAPTLGTAWLSTLIGNNFRHNNLALSTIDIESIVRRETIALGSRT